VLAEWQALDRVRLGGGGLPRDQEGGRLTPLAGQRSYAVAFLEILRRGGAVGGDPLSIVEAPRVHPSRRRPSRHPSAPHYYGVSPSQYSMRILAVWCFSRRWVCYAPAGTGAGAGEAGARATRDGGARDRPVLGGRLPVKPRR
jgi:hypothetical protein